MERVFQKLLMAFGNQMSAKWDGFNLDEVYADWAESASNLTLGAINHGIELSKHCKHPPSQGEFIELCKQYKPEERLKLDHKLTPEQIEANKEKLKEIMANIKSNWRMQ
jgi:hypothetical protein